MVSVSFTCPVCKKSETVDIDPAQIEQAPRNPVPVVVTHGTPEHAITLFIDREFHVRAINASNIVQRIEESRERYSRLSKRIVPFPKKGGASLTGLSGTQCALMSMIDGETTIKEIAATLQLSEMKVKILCEQLVRLGKIESVRVVISEK